MGAGRHLAGLRRANLLAEGTGACASCAWFQEVAICIVRVAEDSFACGVVHILLHHPGHRLFLLPSSHVSTLKPVYLASFFTQSLASVVAAFAFCLATLLLSSYSRSEWPERVKMLKCPGATILMPLTSARTISPDSLTLGSIRGSPDHDCDTTTCSIC